MVLSLPKPQYNKHEQNYLNIKTADINFYVVNHARLRASNFKLRYIREFYLLSCTITKIVTSNDLVKSVFSKKASKFDKIFTDDLTITTKCQIDDEDFINFRGLLRKYKLYSESLVYDFYYSLIISTKT